MKRLILFAALIAWSGMASAVVYKWVDAQGKTQYGDRPPDGVHAEVVDLLVNHQARAEPARPAAASATNSSAKPAAAANSPKDQADKEQVAQDVTQTRDKQCIDAQDHYKQLIEGRRIYKDGANGERQYLSDSEIDNERLNAKRAVDEICSSST
jgi:Domain of unknown function (DUF4124)